MQRGYKRCRAVYGYIESRYCSRLLFEEAGTEIKLLSQKSLGRVGEQTFKFAKVERLFTQNTCVRA